MLQPRTQRRGERRGARHETKAHLAGGDLDAHIGASFPPLFPAFRAEQSGTLPGTVNSSAVMPPGSTNGLPISMPGASRYPPPHIEHRIGADNAQGFGGAGEHEGLAFAQVQQACSLVNLGAGQHHGGDRRRRSVPRGCSACVAALVRAVRRWFKRIQRSPSAEIARLACVRARTRGSPSQARRHTAHRQFHCGNPPTGRGTEHDGGQLAHRPLRRGPGPVPGSLTSEFGRQIAVDLRPMQISTRVGSSRP